MEQILNDGVGVSCEMIIKDGDKILMGKRGKVFGEGSWALPGGHLEKNERAEECARRELKEEVGIDPIKIRLVGIINDLPNILGQERQYLRFVFLIEEYSGEIINKEPDKCESWEWFDINNLPEPIFVGHIKVLESFLKESSSFYIEK